MHTPCQGHADANVEAAFHVKYKHVYRIALAQGWVMHTLCHILPQLTWRPYLRRAEQWQLTALALRVLRQALAASYSCGQAQPAARALGTALLRTLAHEGALAGYLLPALPPSAGAGYTHTLPS